MSGMPFSEDVTFRTKRMQKTGYFSCHPTHVLPTEVPNVKKKKFTVRSNHNNEIIE